MVSDLFVVLAFGWFGFFWLFWFVWCFYCFLIVLIVLVGLAFLVFWSPYLNYGLSLSLYFSLSGAHSLLLFSIVIVNQNLVGTYAEHRFRKTKQKRNLMWTVRNLSVFTIFRAHVHCE